MQKPDYRPPYDYCPRCAQPLGAHEPYRQECASCGFVLYHTSSPTMGAVPLDGSGRVLLARRAIEPFRGDWNTIGGFLEYGEDPIEGLVREVREETGVDCTITGFITMKAGTYGPNGQALLNTYFSVTLLSDRTRPQDDVSELKWFDIDDLPGNIAFESDRQALDVLRQQLKRIVPHE